MAGFRSNNTQLPTHDLTRNGTKSALKEYGNIVKWLFIAPTLPLGLIADFVLLFVWFLKGRAARIYQVE